MKKYFILMSAALVALSCAKELADPQEATGNENITYKTITFESIATKTTLDGVTGNVAWEEGDQISIYYVNAEGKAAETVATAAYAGAITTFSAQIPETENPEAYYAAYPKGVGRLTVTEATAETPASVSFAVYVAPTQCDGTFKDANIAAAYTLAGESMTLAFKNAVGIVKVQLPEGGVISNNGKDYKISGVYIRGINGADKNNGNITVETAEGAVSGFGVADGTKNIDLSNLSDEAIASGYAYLPSATCNWTNGICLKYLTSDGDIPAVLSQNKSIVIERGHVLSLPDVSELVVFDYYVSLDGTGEGLSSDKPMSFIKMQEMFTAAGATMSACYKLDGATFHLADGDYVLSETFTIPASANNTTYSVTIKGNGASKTILNGNSACIVMKVGNYINLTLKGMALKNGSTSNGAGLYLAWGNKSSDGNSIVTCEDCLFASNKATGSGGALLSQQSATGGLARFNNCIFESNSATKGAVLYTIGYTAFMFNKCTFRSNSATENGMAFNVGSSTVYNTRLAMNNCTLNAGTNKKTNGTGMTSTGYTVVVNSTLWSSGQVGDRGMVGSGIHSSVATPSGSAYVNCFVKNIPTATYDYPAFWLHGSYYQNIIYSIYTGVKLNSNATSEGEAPTYTTVASYNYPGTDIAGKGEATASVNGLTQRTYKWTWVDDFKNNYTCPTLQQVKDAIKATAEIGPVFLAWLETVDGAFTTDILGRERNINAMCPGSYQQADTPVPAN